MRRILSNFVARKLRDFGFALVPIEELQLRYREKLNFANLCAAYEFCLAQIHHSSRIPEDSLRARLLSRQFGTPPSEAYFIIEALAETENVPGDVCEFGVAQGELSAVMANEIRSSARCLHLFDSFEGLPQPSQYDILMDDVLGLGSIEAYAGTMRSPENEVRTRLAAVGFPSERFVIHKGYFNDLLDTKAGFPEKVSFAYVDFDFHDPIVESLHFLHETTSNGAVIIVDDYDFFSAGAKRAVDSFVSENNRGQITYTIEIPDKRVAHFAILKRISDSIP
jgi:O-methyltransferase